MPDRVPEQKLDWDTLAEQRIREAQAAGQFENLPGFGQPIPGLDQPHDELWWVKEKLKREQLSSLPPALEIRLDVERTLKRVAALHAEEQVRETIRSLNERIRKASLGPVWGPPVDVVPLDVDEVVAQWRKTNAPAT